MADPNVAQNILSGFNAMQQMQNAPRLEAERRASVIVQQAMQAAQLADIQQRTSQQGQSFPLEQQMKRTAMEQTEKDRAQAEKDRLKAEAQEPYKYLTGLTTTAGGGHSQGAALEKTIAMYGEHLRPSLTAMLAKEAVKSGRVPTTKTVETPGQMVQPQATWMNTAEPQPQPQRPGDELSGMQMLQMALPALYRGFPMQTPQQPGPDLSREQVLPPETLGKPQDTLGQTVPLDLSPYMTAATKTEVPLTQDEIVQKALMLSSPEVEMQRETKESLIESRSARIRNAIGQSAEKAGEHGTYGQIAAMMPLHGATVEDVARFKADVIALETGPYGSVKTAGKTPQQIESEVMNHLYNRVAERKLLTSEMLAQNTVDTSKEVAAFHLKDLALRTEIAATTRQLGEARNAIARINADTAKGRLSVSQTSAATKERDKLFNMGIKSQLDSSTRRKAATEKELQGRLLSEQRATDVLNELVALQKSGGKLRNATSGQDEYVSDGDIAKARITANIARSARTAAAKLDDSAGKLLSEINRTVDKGVQLIGRSVVVPTGDGGKPLPVGPADIVDDLSAARARQGRGVPTKGKLRNGLAYTIREIPVKRP